MASVTTSIICNDLIVEVTITELPDGTLQFDVETSGEAADIRGVFFDMIDDDPAGSLSVVGDDVTDYQFENNKVRDLGNGANMRGSDSKNGEKIAKFDAGVEIGTQGASPDDIPMTSFIIADSSGPLLIADIDVERIGIRLTSTEEPEIDPETGEPTGGVVRTGSLKLILDGEIPPPPLTAPVDEKVDVFESGLPNGSGTDPAGSATEIMGTLPFDPTFNGGTTITKVTHEGVDYFPVGDVITVDTEFGLWEINRLTGDYTYTLEDNTLGHTTAGFAVDLEEELFSYVIEDSFGQTAVGEFAACIHDDVPVADIERNANMAVTDETVGLPDPDGDNMQVGNDEAGESVTLILGEGLTLIGKDTADVIDLGTNHTTGADGGTEVITLEILNADSGLTTTDGTGISLFLVDSKTIVGRANDGADAPDPAGEAIFAMKIDDLGNLTLEQYESLNTSNNGTDDEAAFLGTGIIQAKMTIVDGDLSGTDTSTDTVDLGGADAASSAIKFEDDGPTAAVSLTENMAVTDESVGLPDPDGPGMQVGNDETNAGAPLVAGETAIGFAQADLIDSSGSDVGEDDEGAPGVSTSLALSAGYTAGTAIGIQTTAGEDIELVDNGGVIEGRVLGGANDGQAVFAIAISGDQVTVEQYESLDHLPSVTADDIMALGTGLVDAVVSITDGDGDTDEKRIDIGASIKFEDDGPTAAVSLTENMAVTDESVGLPDPDGPGMQVGNDETNAGAPLVAGETAIGFAQADLIDSSGSDVGEDDEGASVASSLDLSAAYTAGTAIGIQTTAGEDIELVKEGNNIVGRVIGTGQAVFAIAILGDQVTVEQYESLDHLPSVTADDIMALGAGLVDAVVTVTDGDGDTDEKRIDIGASIKFEDDGPALGTIADSTDSLPFVINTMEMKTFSFDVGEDDEGAPGLALTGFTDPDDAGELAASGLGDLEALLGEDITASQVGNVVTYYTEGDVPLFRLTLSDEGGGQGKWAFEVLQDAPFVALDLDLGALEPGSPVEDEIFTGTTGSGLDVVFDGLNWRALAGGDTSLTNAAANLGPGDPDDDINTNQQGFGIKDGQASQVNNLEGFFAKFGDGAGPDDDEVVGFFFDIEGIGNIDEVTINWLVFDDLDNDGILDAGESSASGSELVALPSGNNDVQFMLTSDPEATSDNLIFIGSNVEFDHVYIQAITPDGIAEPTDEGSWNDGVRFNDFGTVERAEIPPLDLSFSAQVTDGDTDATQVEDWFVFVG